MRPEGPKHDPLPCPVRFEKATLLPGLPCQKIHPFTELSMAHFIPFTLFFLPFIRLQKINLKHDCLTKFYFKTMVFVVHSFIFSVAINVNKRGIHESYTFQKEFESMTKSTKKKVQQHHSIICTNNLSN